MIILGMLGTQEIVIVLLIILIITGGSFLPRLMRNFGKNVRKFNESTKDSDEKIDDTINAILQKHGAENK